VIGSLALHGLFLLFPRLDPPQADAPPSIQIDRLVTVVEPVEPEPTPEPPPEPPAVPDTEPTPPTNAPPQPPPIEPGQPDEPNQQDEQNPPNQSAPNPLLLRRHALATARGLGPDPEGSAEPNALAPASIPALPGSSGWINEHLGPVSSRVDHWQANDGSRSSRIVLPGGRIICGRARAPSSAELFNPSLALNMMFFGECGRQRPEPADRSDPWLRVPGDSR
jgi:type IV secretory pathway VirB10-like protein